MTAVHCCVLPDHAARLPATDNPKRLTRVIVPHPLILISFVGPFVIMGIGAEQRLYPLDLVPILLPKLKRARL